MENSNNRTSPLPGASDATIHKTMGPRHQGHWEKIRRQIRLSVVETNQLLSAHDAVQSLPDQQTHQKK